MCIISSFWGITEGSFMNSCSQQAMLLILSYFPNLKKSYFILNIKYLICIKKYIIYTCIIVILSLNKLEFKEHIHSTNIHKFSMVSRACIDCISLGNSTSTVLSERERERERDYFKYISMVNIRIPRYHCFLLQL